MGQLGSDVRRHVRRRRLPGLRYSRKAWEKILCVVRRTCTGAGGKACRAGMFAVRQGNQDRRQILRRLRKPAVRKKRAESALK